MHCRLLSLSALLAAGLALAGCRTVTPPRLTVSQPERVLDKNYVLGQEKTAFVGESIVRHKDYWVVRSSRPAFQASMPFTLTGGHLGADVSFSGGTTERFNYAGDTFILNAMHKILVLPGHPLPGFLIRQDGSFAGRAVNLQGNNVLLFYNYQIEPPEVRFELVQAEQISRDAAYTNFEIVYTGRTAEAINLLYREYTPDDLARPAFTQELTYDPSVEIVRFRSIRIRVLEATNESLRYVVLEDGSGGPPGAAGGG